MEAREAREGRDLRPAAPYREDCWSEGSTSALIDAWGDRYLLLNRGNLRHKDWQEVADAVNSRRTMLNSNRPARTDSQCKNRIDTLKKKYKSEKARIIASGGSSLWPFFPRLESLIGNSQSLGINKTTPSPPLALPLPSHRSKPPTPLPAARPVKLLTPTSDTFRRNYSAAAAAAAAAAEDSESSSSSSRERSPTPVKRRRPGGGDGVRQLAAAIERFAEVYEKVEEEKQRRVMELERKRMEFMKRLEFQRMQAFVDSLVQLERVKRARRGDGGEQASSALLSCLLQPCFFTV